MLLKITDYLLQSMDQGQISGLTLIDLRMAFDLIDHTTLLHKLQLYGLNKDAVTWFRSYLSDRQFQVVIDNQFSTKANSTSGVPSWTGHVDFLCKSISQRLGALKRIRHYLPYKARVAFYNCLILSLMDYCCVVWGNTPKQNLDRIYRLQKRAARLILDVDSKAPSLPLFVQLGWLPIYDRIKYFRAVTVYKALHNLAPSYISNLIRPINLVHSFKTRGSVKDSLQLPKVTSKSGQRMFAFLASSEWNTLDPDIRNAPSLPSFRNRYLKMVFSKFEDSLIVL